MTTPAKLPKVLNLAPGIVIGPEVVTKRLALLGQSESGKTNAVADLGEELYPLGAPILAVDGVGNLHGWRSSADGLSEGLGFAIFGGERADVPITPEAGAALARELVIARASAIIDVSEMTDEEARIFVRDFVNELYRYNRAPLHLLLDEAHQWAPERPETPAHWQCRNAVVRIRKLGRNRGIGSTIASQSSAEVAKAALGQTDALFALRTSAPTDVAPIIAWAKGHLSADDLKTIRATIGTLDVGEAWLISPGYLKMTKRIRFRLRHTFDSSRTPTLGEEVREPTVFAPVDLERIARAIEADRAGDVKPVVIPRIVQARTEYVNVIGTADLDALEAAVLHYHEAAGQLAGTIERFRAKLDQVAAIAASPAAIVPVADRKPPAALPAPVAPNPPPPEKRLPAVTQAPVRANSTATAAKGAPKSGALRMLEALRAVGQPLTRRELGTLAGVTPTSGTMSEYVGDLRRRGFVDEAEGVVAITTAGNAYLVDRGAGPARAPTTAQILDLHSPHLKSGMRRMLDLLVSAYPNSLTRKVAGAQANINPTSGTMSEYAGTLRRRGLVDDARGGGLRAADILFIATQGVRK